MALRVLLANSNQCSQPYAVFPLGLAHLDAALRGAGHVTSFYDSGMAGEPVAAAIAAFQPDVIGVSCRNVDDIQFARRETYFDAPRTIVAAARTAGEIPVVLGGSAFSLYPAAMLERSGAAYGIQGEGEIAFVRLLELLEQGGAPASVPGLVWRDGSTIRCNPRQPLAGSAIGPAARRPELADHYIRQSSMLNIQTQRGCGFQCCYCTYPVIEGRTPRRREPAAVVEELLAIQRLGARHVFIADSVFNTSNEHVTAICELMVRCGVTLKWSCFLRPHGLTSEMMQLMVRAGLTHIEFGADSFCDEVLVEYGKSFTFADIVQASELARQSKVHFAHFLICGGPGETPATLAETFARSQRLSGAVVFGLAGMRIYPGTSLADRAVREGLLAPDADLLEPVYYVSPAFTAAELLATLDDFKRRATNWIVGDLPANWPEFSRKIRERGVIGPLWEYYRTLRLAG